jgi:hypothetical protein
MSLPTYLSASNRGLKEAVKQRTPIKERGGSARSTRQGRGGKEGGGKDAKKPKKKATTLCSKFHIDKCDRSDADCMFVHGTETNNATREQAETRKNKHTKG